MRSIGDSGKHFRNGDVKLFSFVLIKLWLGADPRDGGKACLF